MSAGPYLTKEQLEFLNAQFEEFKSDSNLTLVKIAQKLNVHETTVGKYYKKAFGEEYSKISRKKCGWNIKLTDKQIKEIFLEYKGGEAMLNLAKKYGVVRDSLTHRMSRVIGKEYWDLACLRRAEDSGRKRQKISNFKIKELFEIYKSSPYSLTELAQKVDLAESSLIFRFKKLFGQKYRKVAISRRDERKITMRGYVSAFMRYKNTNISLTQLADEMGIKISSLAPRFRRIFGIEYCKIAERKSDALEIGHRGKLTENLALEYLKLQVLKFEDVRNKVIIKHSLKRPDFLIGTKFVEVKTNYVTKTGFGKIKGYEGIKKSYLNQETVDGRILSSGVIISLSGFSPEIKNLAEMDKIELVGPDKLELVFKNNNRLDLVDSLRNLRGL